MASNVFLPLLNDHSGPGIRLALRPIRTLPRSHLTSGHSVTRAPEMNPLQVAWGIPIMDKAAMGLTAMNVTGRYVTHHLP